MDPALCFPKMTLKPDFSVLKARCLRQALRCPYPQQCQIQPASNLKLQRFESLQFQLRFLSRDQQILENKSILAKKLGPQRKKFGGRYGILVFIGLCIYHRLGKFFFEAREVLQKISLQWWQCTPFFFSADVEAIWL